jgi:hypothetical protein
MRIAILEKTGVGVAALQAPSIKLLSQSKGLPNDGNFVQNSALLPTNSTEQLLVAIYTRKGEEVEEGWSKLRGRRLACTSCIGLSF